MYYTIIGWFVLTNLYPDGDWTTSFLTNVLRRMIVPPYINVTNNVISIAQVNINALIARFLKDVGQL